MSFTPNVPLANQKISNTTTPIRTNFTELFNQLQNDHVSINDVTPSLRLTHKQVTLNVGVVPVTAANQVAVYAKQVGGITELFMRRQNNGSEIALSSGGLTPNLVINGGYTFLPGGLVDMWGEIVGFGNGLLTLPNPGTAVISQIYSMQLTLKGAQARIIGVTIGAGNQFTAACGNLTGGLATATVYYRAIVAV